MKSYEGEPLRRLVATVNDTGVFVCRDDASTWVELVLNPGAEGEEFALDAAARLAGALAQAAALGSTTWEATTRESSE